MAGAIHETGPRGPRNFRTVVGDRTRHVSGKHSGVAAGGGESQTSQLGRDTALTADVQEMPRIFAKAARKDETRMGVSESCPICGGILTPEDHDHRQVPLLSEYGVHAHIDEGLVELIGACWWLGIHTLGSCQEDPDTGEACIAFAPGCGERFVGAATTEDLDDPATFESLGWRMRGNDPNPWRWQPGGFAWAVSFAAFFPPSDIPELVQRLRRWE